MRVVISNSMITWGGGENWSLTAASGLAERGHEIVVVCRPESELGKRAESAGLTVKTVQLRGDLNPLAVIRLCCFFKGFRPDVIVCNVDREVRSLGIAARLSGRIPFIRRRGSDYAFKNAWRYRASYRYLVDRVLVNSRSTCNTILSGNPWMPEKKLHMIYNGIRESQFFPDREAGLRVRRELGMPEDAFVAGMMGSFLPRKEHGTLIRAAHSVPSLFLLLSGPAPDERFFKEVRSSVSDIAERVFFPGPVTDLNGYYNAMDLFVMPSSNEGFGYAAAEAMCSGIPAAVSNATSLPEVVGDAGFIFPVEDFRALTSILKKCISGEADLAALASAGRRRVLERFTLSRMLDDLEIFLKREAGFEG
ncbi:hypothetical protein CSA37_06510 [Candidatus Fermentibacteria bacterium]|nr:MAG: hypothetical protein CSA37_06510 [Candidatus Fermentibacteria bacterium]